MKEKASDRHDYIAESRIKTSKHTIVITAQRNEEKFPMSAGVAKPMKMGTSKLAASRQTANSIRMEGISNTSVRFNGMSTHALT